MLNKLTNEQKERLTNLCEQINYIFTEEDNKFTEETIDEWYESKLYKGIEDTMRDLGRWC